MRPPGWRFSSSPAFLETIFFWPNETILRSLPYNTQFYKQLLFPEAVARNGSMKKVFWEISQNWQEYISTRGFLMFSGGSKGNTGRKGFIHLSITLPRHFLYLVYLCLCLCSALFICLSIWSVFHNHFHFHHN